MTQAVIYALLDPRDGAVRYVGKTGQRLSRRLAMHIRHAAKAQWPVSVWIRSLVEAGTTPEIHRLEIAGEDWGACEQRWIDHFRAAGAELTNVTRGGTGCTGLAHTPEARAKIRAAATGRRHTPEAIAKMKSHTFSEEHRRRISEAKKGKVVISPEQRAATSAFMTGRRPSDETRAKLRARVHTEEARAKRSEAMKRFYAAQRRSP